MYLQYTEDAEPSVHDRQPPENLKTYLCIIPGIYVSEANVHIKFTVFFPSVTFCSNLSDEMKTLANFENDVIIRNCPSQGLDGQVGPTGPPGPTGDPGEMVRTYVT